MANQATQILDILKGTIAPPSNVLIDLVAQVGLLKAIAFYDAPKTVPALGETPTEQEQSDFDNATKYINKMYRVCERIIKNDTTVFPVLNKIVATQLILEYSYGALNGATDNFWETRVDNEMKRSLELFAGIKTDEKTAYDNIV